MLEISVRHHKRMDRSRSTQVRRLKFCTSRNDDLFVLNYVGVLLVLIFIFEGLDFSSFLCINENTNNIPIDISQRKLSKCINCKSNFCIKENGQDIYEAANLVRLIFSPYLWMECFEDFS